MVLISLLTLCVVDYSLANPDTLTKYKLAGEISAKVLEQVKAACVPGALIIDVSILGDKLIEEETAKIYKGKKIAKGGFLRFF